MFETLDKYFYTVITKLILGYKNDVVDGSKIIVPAKYADNIIVHGGNYRQYYKKIKIQENTIPIIVNLTYLDCSGTKVSVIPKELINLTKLSQ